MNHIFTLSYIVDITFYSYKITQKGIIFAYFYDILLYLFFFYDNLSTL